MGDWRQGDWTGAFAPSVEDIESLAARAWRRLPAGFRKLCEDVVIRVEDFPTREVLNDLGMENEFDVMGLFQGVGLVQGGAGTGSLPNMVFLYRRPILDYWAEHQETLGAIVTHVLVHEIGHHFGLSDEDMARAEAESQKR